MVIGPCSLLRAVNDSAAAIHALARGVEQVTRERGRIRARIEWRNFKETKKRRVVREELDRGGR